MDGHGGGGGDEGPLGRHRQGHADGVTASQNQRSHRLGHGGDELGDGQPRLDIAAHGVEHDQKTVDVLCLLHSGQLGQDVLILGGLGVVLEDLVSLDLPHDGDAVDPGPGGDGTHV